MEPVDVTHPVIALLICSGWLFPGWRIYDCNFSVLRYVDLLHIVTWFRLLRVALLFCGWLVRLHGLYNSHV